MFLPKGAQAATEMLKASGYEAYVVGGAVRSYVLNLPASDYDITTSATPEEILAVFKGYQTYKVGIRHGTIGVVLYGGVYEITTFRTEGGYSDNRHPDAVSFVRSLKEDLTRRDFTVNAMCYDGEKIIDLFGGISDCKNRILRCIGESEKRFHEDALRILRALRFASKLGFSIEENTKKAMFECKELIKNISVERIREEFIGILRGDNVERVLSEYREIIAVFIPEIACCFDFDQHTKYHDFDVYTHTVKAVSHVKNTPDLRLAAFFHDIGKPSCFFTDEGGQGHFYGHPKKSREIAERVLERLKCPKTQENSVLQLVEFHDAPIVPKDAAYPKEKYILRALGKFGEDLLRDIIELKRADNSAKSDTVPDLCYFDELEDILSELIKKQACFSLKDLKVNGKDMMELGARGKKVGETLGYLLDKVMVGEVANEKPALTELAKKFLSNTFDKSS